MAGILRLAAGAAALPFQWMGESVHGWLSGPQAIVDVKVTRLEDLISRQQLVHRIRRMASDPHVAAVLLRLESPPGGSASCQDLRQAIQAVRRRGKAVYAWMETPGNATMWIASACDRVFMVPMGEVGLVGVGVELTFFGAAFSRLGIEPDFEAAGAYKSFGETYTRSFASPANHEAMSELVADLHGQMVSAIAEGRGKSIAEMQALLAQAPIPAEEALEAGLVDQLYYEDQLEDWIEQHHGERSKLIPYATWALRDRVLERLERAGEGGTSVAVVHLEGPIVMDGRGNQASIRARKVLPILKALREDESVGAVVLHINSPGGSALASDLMWREIEKLGHDKPVVAAFEDVSASGGFYIAAPAVEIIARQATLTGSIGVFGGKLVAGDGLRKIGVHTQEIVAAPNANLFTVSRPFTDAQRVRFKDSLQRFYDGFVQRVASGRRRPEEAIEPHCRGRVWTGAAARERGLIDRHGDLYDAVDRARSLAGLHLGEFVRKDIDTRPQTWMSRMVNNAVREIRPGASLLLDHWVLRVLGRLIAPRVTVGMDFISAHQGEPLALLPFDLDVR